MKKQIWLFLLIGLPVFIFQVLIIIGYQVVNGTVMAITGLALFATTLRRKNFCLRFTRATVVGLVMCFVTIGSLVENPSLWISQIGRHIDKNSLIKPEAAKIQELEDAFDWWLDNGTINEQNRLTYYGMNLTDTSKPMEDRYWHQKYYSIDSLVLSLEHFKNASSLGAFSDFQKLVIVDYFIRWCVIHWTEDSKTHGISDHVPVPDEALSRWQFNETWKNDPENIAYRAYDDCDGIAVVTVSFIRRLQAAGYIQGQTYIGCGKGHWFTSVLLNETTPFVFLNHWEEIQVYGIFMGNNLPAWGQNIYETLGNSLILEQEDIEELSYYLDLIVGNIGILIALGVVVSILALLFFGYPRDYEIEKERERVGIAMEKYKQMPKFLRCTSWLFLVKIGNPFQRRHMYFWLNVICTTALLVLGVLALKWIFLATPLYTYVTMYMYLAIFSILYLLDRDAYVFAFKRLYLMIYKRPHQLLR